MALSAAFRIGNCFHAVSRLKPFRLWRSAISRHTCPLSVMCWGKDQQHRRSHRQAEVPRYVFPHSLPPENVCVCDVKDLARRFLILCRPCARARLAHGSPKTYYASQLSRWCRRVFALPLLSGVGRSPHGDLEDAIVRLSARSFSNRTTNEPPKKARYMTLETIAPLSDDPAVSFPAIPS